MSFLLNMTFGDEERALDSSTHLPRFLPAEEVHILWLYVYYFLELVPTFLFAGHTALSCFSSMFLVLFLLFCSFFCSVSLPVYLFPALESCSYLRRDSFTFWACFTVCTLIWCFYHFVRRCLSMNATSLHFGSL